MSAINKNIQTLRIRNICSTLPQNYKQHQSIWIRVTVVHYPSWYKRLSSFFYWIWSKRVKASKHTRQENLFEHDSHADTNCQIFKIVIKWMCWSAINFVHWGRPRDIYIDVHVNIFPTGYLSVDPFQFGLVKWSRWACQVTAFTQIHMFFETPCFKDSLILWVALALIYYTQNKTPVTDEMHVDDENHMIKKKEKCGVFLKMSKFGFDCAKKILK